ncbi:MAG: hypothetical protein K2H87_04145, partial [Duncaniella sp.]|nr:hypothetical protein [Duncaniella sp.]
IAEIIRDLGMQIDHNRECCVDGNRGVAVYSAKFIPKVEKMLASKFPTPSLSPELTRYPKSMPDAPTGARRRGATLTWNAVEGEPGEVMRYTVYAIPRGVRDEDAMAEDGDGIDGSYLMGVYYGTEAEIPAGYDGYRMAVCTFDSRSTESSPAWVR